MAGVYEFLRFVVFLLKSRWFSLYASLIMLACSGSYVRNFRLGIAKFGYDKSTLKLLNSVHIFWTSYGGIFAGLIAEVTPTWFVLLLGTAMHFIGYLILWLGFTKKIVKPAIWLMCGYVTLGAAPIHLTITTVTGTCVKNFPESRGIVLAILIGYQKMTWAIMTQLWHAFYSGDKKAMILFSGWFPAVITVMFVYAIRPMKIEKKENELNVFYHFLCASIVFALLFMVISVTKKYIYFSQGTQEVIAAAFFVLHLFPLLIIIRKEWVRYKLNQRPPHPLSSIETTQKTEISSGSSSPCSTAKTPTPFFSNIFKNPPIGEDHTILQALLSVEMMLIFILSLFSLGSNWAAKNNLGQVGVSLGYKSQTTNAFVSIQTAWNFIGKLFVGFLSEILLMRYKVPRTLMMTLMLLFNTIAYLLIAFPVPGSLYISSVIIGISFGAQMSLTPTVVSEIFGLRYFFTLFNCAQLAIPVSMNLFSVKLTSPLYDIAINKELARLGQKRIRGQDITCIGSYCFRILFTVLAAINFVSTLVSFILVKRTQKFYKDNVYVKLRENAKKNKAAQRYQWFH